MTTWRILWAAVALLVAGPALAEFKPSPTDMIKDLESMTKTEDHITVVIWLPSEYWRASLEAGGKITPKEIDKIVKELDPYVIIAAADGQIGIAGAVNFSEPELVRNSASIEDGRGHVFSPLPDAEVSEGVRNLTQMMRPMFANMLGSLGAHLAFAVFPGTENGGGRVVEPAKEGSFVVHIGTAAMHYRLPLASLLPPAVDEKTHESFPGNYQFNPFTGSKLTHTAPATTAEPTAH
jgi:hypothetical protein